MAKVLEGYVGDGAGEPLDAIAATVTKVADGSAVTAGATDVNGRWRFTGLAEADEYFVTLVDGAGRAVVRGPWSGELREAWVRDRLAMPAAATAVLPEGDTTFLGTLAFDPAVGDGALDHRYVDIDGDTMTGTLVVPALTVAGVPINQTALDARYVNTAGDAMTGALTAPSLLVGGNDISYASLDARYVNTSGDAMSGTLAVPSLTVAGVAINQTTLDTRYVNVTGDAMTGSLTIAGVLGVTGDITSNAMLRATAPAPSLRLRETDAGADDKVWDVSASAGQLLLHCANDAESSVGGNDIVFNRAGLNLTTTLFRSGGVAFLTVNHTSALVNATNLQANSRPVIMAGCRVYHTATQSATHNAATTLAFNSERYDTDGFHDPATNNSRLTVPAGQAGKYLITAQVGWAASSAGVRQQYLQVNGSTRIAELLIPPPGAFAFAMPPLTTIYDLAAGDYVEVIVVQSTGGALSTSVAGNYFPEFMMQRIG
jgi:hypothetical protein